jgi:ribosomal protein L11 methyltransferase
MLLAMVDDFAPTAVEERDDSVRVFFSDSTDRDAARMVLASRFPVAAIDVPDEDWARRSQEDLQPITVGRITVSPRPLGPLPAAISPQSSDIVIVITPSMGFGTGHHATTRLCLEALQQIDLTDAVVLDIGTGSGVLAIAADQLGAALVFGIDNDTDAIQAACENLGQNWAVRHVTFGLADLASSPLPQSDVITANLTGAVLVRSAGRLVESVRAGGVLILSGLQIDERDDVVRAFAPGRVEWERTEDEWVGLIVKKP